MYNKTTPVATTIPDPPRLTEQKDKMISFAGGVVNVYLEKNLGGFIQVSSVVYVVEKKQRTCCLD